jgi:ubiquinone/menaquinone biosynthesis C-methylase UbiE
LSESIQYDEAWGERLVKIYSTPDVIKQRQIILSSLNLKPGERILDIGSGPGLLIQDMATVIGQKGSICGIEISEPFIELSKKRCSHLSQVEIQNGDATSIPYGNDEFDVAVSIQVYEYIDDVDKCLIELYRILKPGGRALIMCTDWDTLIWNTENQERMQRILTTFETHCAEPRLPRKISPKLRDSGFNLIKHGVYTMLNPDYDDNTYSHGIIDFIVSYVSGKNGIKPKEAKSWADELREKGQHGGYFFSICRYFFVVSKPG